jgi:hypothetical protein
VIGVVGDLRSQRVDRVPRPQLYAVASRTAPAIMTLVARSRGDRLRLAAAVRAAVRRIDSAQSVADLRTVAAIVSDARRAGACRRCCSLVSLPPR